MNWLGSIFGATVSVPVAQPAPAPVAVVALPPAPQPLISANTLRTFLAVDPELWAPVLDKACRHYGIDTQNRLAAFLATILHESANFRHMKENLYYSTPSRIRATWPSRFPTDASAVPYSKNPERLANKVYASRMGNGDEASGDGARYAGRGLLQITGKSNYQAASVALGVPMAGMPAYLETLEGAAYSAAWWFSAHGCLAQADRGDIKAVRKTVNGGYIGLAEVTACYNRLLPLCRCDVVS